MCRHSVVKLHEATQVFMVADYVREMTEEVMCVKYGPFEHLLFLFLSGSGGRGMGSVKLLRYSAHITPISSSPSSPVPRQWGCCLLVA